MHPLLHSGGRRAQPDLREELLMRQTGCRRVAGIDEAGRGPWAGPVCAAAVVLPLGDRGLRECLSGVRDSKLLSPAQRTDALSRIVDVAESIGLGWALSAEVDAAGIVVATQRAMARALARLRGGAEGLLIDFVSLPECDLPQRSLAKADARCLSVAAASIVAKVARDRLMARLDRAYPGYGFAAHKGYGTPMHAHSLASLGPCPIHRMSWEPLRRLCG